MSLNNEHLPVVLKNWVWSPARKTTESTDQLPVYYPLIPGHTVSVKRQLSMGPHETEKLL